MKHSTAISRAGSPLLVLVCWGMTASASVHMPYVLPARFDVGTRAQITAKALFTEDAFRPEIAMRDAPFEITAPDGREVAREN